MGGVLAVEMADLRGWSTMVGRAGTDASGVGSYAAANIPDGDFGMILGLITGDYDNVLSQFRGVLDADGTRLGKFSDAVSAAGRELRTTDNHVASRFQGAGVADDGSTGSAFSDLYPVLPVPAPSTSGVDFPTVSMGMVIDSVLGIIKRFTGIDIREEITQHIEGNAPKAMRQADAWDKCGTAVEQIMANLTQGDQAVAVTWIGEAADAAASAMAQWLSSLQAQAAAMHEMAGHLRDMVQQAFDMAQVVVDILQTIFGLAKSIGTEIEIPIWGEYKAYKLIKQVISLIWKARNVISTFLSALRMIKDTFVMTAHAFSVEALPAVANPPAA